MNNYKEMVLWKKAHESTLKVLDITESFPKNNLSEVIIRQIIRSSTSVPANIAEGFGGRKGKEFISYLYQARKSITETDYWLFLTKQRKLISEKQYSDLTEKYIEVSKIVNYFIKKLKSNSGETNH